MTTVPRVTGSKLLVKIGDGASPETFAHDCFINTQRGIQFTSETDEVIMPDCDNPDDPNWKEVTKDGLMATITGSGRLYISSIDTFDAWFRGSATKNVQVLINAAGGGYWAGAFHLTQFDLGAEGHKQTIEANVTLVSDGEVTWQPAS